MRIIGLMSGTSVDAVDVAVCDVTPSADDECALDLRLAGYTEQPFPEGLRERILSLFQTGCSPLADLAELDFLLGDAFAGAVLSAAESLSLDLSRVDLIASHGQTIYHLVEPGRRRSTLQLGEAAVIAEATGLTVVSDFRVADMAAGGQGAPLVSFFDALLFAGTGRTVALQNTGGVGNVTFVPEGDIERAYAFDTGPGNALIDYGARRFSGGRRQYDQDGVMARAGRVNPSLLEEVLAHPYFAQPPPKTTGRELFGDAFAVGILERADELGLSPEDTMATLTAITAESIARAYRQFGPERIDEVIVSGGGARNGRLMELIQEGVDAPVKLYDSLGWPSEAKEAAVFALLGYEAVHGRPANLPRCTGARRPVVLGKITPGDNYLSIMARVADGRDGCRAIHGLSLVC